MDEIQKEALKRSRVYLVNRLLPDAIWDYLISEGVFNDIMLEYIKCRQPRSEQVRSLITDLMRRHKEAYNGFLKCLTQTGHEHCAKEILKNERAVREERGQLHGTQETCQESQGVVSVGTEVRRETLQQNPSGMVTNRSTPLQLMQRSEDVVMTEDGDRQVKSPTQVSDAGAPSQLDTPIKQETFVGYEWHKTHKADEIYQMESDPRGYVYIINNKQFTHLTERHGTDVDCVKLKAVFEKIGFHVHVDTNLTCQEMKQRLMEFSRYGQLQSVDSCIVVILSHGGKSGIVFGTDGCTADQPKNYITEDDLYKWFGSRLSPHLAEKPKLFLIQACRGTNEDQGFPSSEMSSEEEQDGVHPDVSVCDQSDSPLSQCLESASIPNHSDMILAHASVPGHVSYRDTQHGTIYISAVVDVFDQCAHDTDMMHMLTKVNNEVAKYQTPKGHKTMPCPSSMLRKKWFLNPVKKE